MIVTQFATKQLFFRFMTPRWSHLPLSGAGAAVGGGRFNRVGVEAVYLSTEHATAYEEIRQGSSIAPPATLAGYKVKADEIVDFSGGFDPSIWTDEWREWDCDWKYVARIDKTTPASWVLGDMLITRGCRGLLYPSVRRPRGTNLVLFPSNMTSSDSLEVHDPFKDLPADQSSWR